MANNYWKDPKAPGATPEERALLDKEIGADIIRHTKISHVTYYKFKRGETVAKFVRERIMQYIYNKHVYLGNEYKKHIKMSDLNTKEGEE